MFDQGNGDCSTYQPGAINEGYCERDEACSSCACTCRVECSSNSQVCQMIKKILDRARDVRSAQDDVTLRHGD